jgi:hypothetical protein
MARQSQDEGATGGSRIEAAFTLRTQDRQLGRPGGEVALDTSDLFDVDLDQIDSLDRARARWYPLTVAANTRWTGAIWGCWWCCPARCSSTASSRWSALRCSRSARPV